MSIVMEPFGDRALRARLPDPVNVAALLGALRSHPHVVDAVVTESHALVVFDSTEPPDGLDEVLVRVLNASIVALPGREHTIAVRYDGEDLSDVARRIGATQEDVISLHTAAEYVVATVGFLPGFAYLRGLDLRLVIPRRPAPRPRVSPRSVAIGGPYTGVYPHASAGGWNVIGTAPDFISFDVRRGASLALGDRVRFTPVAH